MSVQNTLETGEGSFNQLFATYKWHAKDRNFEFLLTREEFQILTKGDCFYCGKPPAQIYKGQSNKTPYVYNGVDRLDNKKGYATENAVSCCKTCNDMKRSRTVEQFLDACNSVVIHQNFKKSAEMTDSLSNEG